MAKTTKTETMTRLLSLCAVAVFSMGAMMVTQTNAATANIEGTWKGTLTSTDGDSEEFEVRFAKGGNPIYEYQTKSGEVHKVVLSKPGQTIRYVPPGGGVQTYVVEAITVSPQRGMWRVATSFEKASAGTTISRNHRFHFEYALAGESMQFGATGQSSSGFGHSSSGYGSDFSASGSGGGERMVAQGILHKVTAE